MATKNNAMIEKNENPGYLALRDTDFSAIMSEEMDGLTVSFDRIKIPIGGSTMFEIPGDDPDDVDAVKEFSAVILFHHPLFAYYKEKYTGGSNPPDCGSFDGVCGDGEPGGRCIECPFNQFGSGENGAKACKNRRRLYLLREGEAFPVLLSLPTASIKGFTRYITRLLSKGYKSNSVVTRFSLKKATNSGGVVYSQVQFSVDRKLTDEEYAIISGMSEQVKTLRTAVGYDAEDAATDAEVSAPLNVDPETGEVIEPLS